MSELERQVQEIEMNDEKKRTATEIYNEGVEKTRYYTQKTWNWFIRYNNEIIMNLVAFFMIGIQQFAEAGFDPFFFLKAQFWYEFLPYIVAQWLVLLSALRGKFKYYFVNDLIYLDLRQGIQNHVDADDGYITVGANIIDRNRKKRKYIQLKSQEMSKLLKKYRINNIEVLEVYLGIKDESSLIDEKDQKLTDTRLLLLKGIKVWGWRENAVKTRLTMLYNQLDDDYIEKNIDNIKITYNRVNYIILTNGFSKSTQKNDDTDFKEHVSSETFSEFGISQITLLLFMFAILALDLSHKEATVMTWVFFMLKSVMLLWNYFQGNARAPIIFNNTYIRALRERKVELDGIKKKHKKVEVVDYDLSTMKSGVVE